MNQILGQIHSFQSLGTVDGPGVRFVVFLQGCNLRCGCCHNPDTWEIGAGKLFSAEEVLQKVLRCRGYFGKDGGITVSGGEPLLQASFVRELFALCQKEGIHTCLDTSGSILNDDVKALLALTDRVLLDIKYTSDGLYRQHVGCPLEKPLAFLAYLNEQKIPVTLRQVIIPTLNDTAENVLALKAVADAHPCVDKIELLPFRKICDVKYQSMGIPFPFADIPEPSKECMERLNAVL
ncbi:MAG: pyruvate formate lyase-activating protein [Clostridia bacterium]|nr:pyruvate formate lyase-activating protein [Clostridia bacterium]